MSLTDEVILTAHGRGVWQREKLVITTHRVRHEVQRWGRLRVRSIMLEQISSCELRATHHPMLLVLAALTVVGAIVLVRDSSAASSAFPIGLLIAALLAVLYVVTRQQALTFTASGATITLGAWRLGTAGGRDVIEIVEGAKNTRYLRPRSASGVVSAP